MDLHLGLKYMTYYCLRWVGIFAALQYTWMSEDRGLGSLILLEVIHYEFLILGALNSEVSTSLVETVTSFSPSPH